MGSIQQFIIERLLWVPGILFGFTIHEFAHAWTAYRLGDDTAEREGRLTLNPMAHLDPFGTLLIFMAGFGWARPVPVNPVFFRHPRRDDFLVTLAGPASNLLTAAVLGLVVRFAGGSAAADSLMSVFMRVLVAAVFINLVLCFFNLIPVFPLDGARIVASILPLNQAYSWRRLEPAGPMILMALIVLGPMIRFDLIHVLIAPPRDFLFRVLTGSAL